MGRQCTYALPRKSFPFKHVLQSTQCKHCKTNACPIFVVQIPKITDSHDILVFELVDPFMSFVRISMGCSGTIADKHINLCIIWIFCNALLSRADEHPLQIIWITFKNSRYKSIASWRRRRFWMVFSFKSVQIGRRKRVMYSRFDLAFISGNFSQFLQLL